MSQIRDESLLFLGLSELSPLTMAVPSPVQAENLPLISWRIRKCRRKSGIGHELVEGDHKPSECNNSQFPFMRFFVYLFLLFN